MKVQHIELLPLEKLLISMAMYTLLLLWSRLLREAARQVWRIRWVLLVLFVVDWLFVSLDLGIIICLENLRHGLTSDPNTVLNWAQVSGSMITLDVGHAVSCERVQSGALSVVDFVEAFADRLHEVHMYERETDRHYPPRDMSILGPIVDRLLETECKWWTIELDDSAEALATRNLLLDYLRIS